MNEVEETLRVIDTEIDYCKMTNQKPSYYKSLQDYRSFLEFMMWHDIEP